MKSKITYYASILITCLFITAAGSGCVTARPQQVQAGVSFSAFYDALSPYGQWVNYQDYGQVWVPDAGRDFRPYYTNGHWVYTDYGWTWMSDYPWGWAPFHYGRWTYDNYYGWVWVPGEEWGPAWVSWRNSNDYYGWAPLTPGVSVGVNVNFGIPTSYWSFVPCQYIASRNIHNYYVDRSRNVTIINNTTIINNVRTANRNTRYYRGPDASDVSRVTRTPVRPVRVVNSDRPGSSLSNNQLRIFRPSGEQLRRPLADNSRPRRIGTDNNNNVAQPGTPGRTIRRSDVDNNTPDNNMPRRTFPGNRDITPAPTPNNVNPDRNNNVPRRTFPDNRNVTPTPSPTPNNVNPDRNNNMPRRTFPDNRNVTPAPAPNNVSPSPAPERNMPRRSFERSENSRPNPSPTPSQPRYSVPQPQRVAPAPQPQRSNPSPAPQRSFSRPSTPAPAPRVQQQSSSPRPQAAPQRSTPQRVNREN